MSKDSETLFLELKDVGLYYHLKSRILHKKKFWALKNISFAIRPGEALGVLGRNGVGKSTLLQVVAGIMRPDTGTIERNIDNISLLSMQVGFIPYLTGRENAILSSLLQGMRRADAISALDEILEFSELGEFFDEPISTYSTGMRARLGFSVALHLDPDLYLIDEVMAVGDVDFRNKSMRALKEKLAQDKSLIFVSHAPVLVQELCDRAIWIEHGEIVMAGDVEPVLEGYRASATH